MGLELTRGIKFSQDVLSAVDIRVVVLRGCEKNTGQTRRHVSPGDKCC